MTAAYLGDERLVDLLLQQATSGLTAAEAAELESLLARFPDADPTDIERTVAVLALAARDDGAPLPAALRTRVLESEASMRSRAATAEFSPRTARRVRGTASGWWAAAAAVLIAVAGWYPRLVPQGTAPSAGQLRAQLIASNRSLVRWDFAATQDPSAHGASGDVVWDPATQRGYLRLRGLAANDAASSQYQLWIFDETRDDRYPVDGGVFDVPAGQPEVVIPIVTRLHVAKPALFAVTVEKPGGVVVSARERIAVLAKPAAT